MNGALMVRRTSSIPKTLRKRDGFNRNQRLAVTPPTPYCLLPTPWICRAKPDKSLFIPKLYTSSMPTIQSHRGGYVQRKKSILY